MYLDFNMRMPSHTVWAINSESQNNSFERVFLDGIQWQNKPISCQDWKHRYKGKINLSSFATSVVSWFSHGIPPRNPKIHGFSEELPLITRFKANCWWNFRLCRGGYWSLFNATRSSFQGRRVFQREIYPCSRFHWW